MATTTHETSRDSALRQDERMGTPVIRIEGVTKVYAMGDNKVYALRGVDLTVQPGEMIAVMGSSGSGKSTLMNILGCLDVPTEGRYFLDGTRVDGLSKNALADLRNQKLGFVFQGFNLLARTTALDNVELPLLYDRAGRWKDTPAQAAQALQRVGLGDRLDHHPSRAVGRTAAARRHRPRARHRSHPAAGRRAHGQPGQPHHGGGHGALSGAERPGHHDSHRHARAGRCPVRQAHRGSA